MYFSHKNIVSHDSPEKFDLLFLPLRSTIPEYKIILFGTLNVYSKKKFSVLEKSRCLYKNNIKSSLLPWNPKLLPQISAKTNKISCTKPYISPEEKFFSECLERGTKRCFHAL